MCRAHPGTSVQRQQKHRPTRHATSLFRGVCTLFGSAAASNAWENNGHGLLPDSAVNNAAATDPAGTIAHLLASHVHVPHFWSAAGSVSLTIDPVSEDNNGVDR